MFDLTNLKKEATRKSYGVYLNELAKKNDVLLWDRNKLISMIEKM